MGRNHSNHSLQTAERPRRGQYRRQQVPTGLVPETIPQEFGLSRAVDTQAAFRIRGVLHNLLLDGSLPENFRISKQIRLDLIPITITGAQIRRGRLDHGKIAQARRHFEEQTTTAESAEIGRVAVRYNKYLRLLISNDDLLAERTAAAEKMDELGFKGAIEFAKTEPLYVTLGKCPKGSSLDFASQQETTHHVLSLLDAEMNIENPLSLEQLKVYPDLSR
jgi:hypothetical protein